MVKVGRLKKQIIAAFVLLTAILLCSCSGGKQSITDDGGSTTDACLEQVLGSLAGSDTDALKAAFSNQALSEAKDFEAQADRLLELFCGTTESWERTGLISTEETVDGKQTSKQIAWYTVITDEDTFRFFLLNRSEDTADTDNVGLYSLWAVKAEDEETYFTDWQDMELAGVHVP